MTLTLSALLAASIFFSLIIFMASSMSRGPGDIVMLCALTFGLFYGLRPLLFVLGLDVPFPENLFWSAESADLLTKTLVGLSLFLVLVIIGVMAVARSGVRGWGPFFVQKRPSLRRLLRVTLILTALATLLSAFLIAFYGGIGPLITAAKVEKSLAGLYVLRTIPAIGAISAIATVLESRNHLAAQRTALIGSICALANASFVFLWGSRSLFVVVGAILVLGLGRQTMSTGANPRTVWRLVMAVLLVIAVAGGLRIARDNLTRGEVQEVYGDATISRQVSLGTNSIQFDAAMLSFRDWPKEYGYRDGEDFVNGALGVVPRFIWSGKPTAISPGKWFRQVYQPLKVNGWPMGASALWYLNFGWGGLVIGGLISGLAIGLIASAQRRAPPGGWNLAVAVVVAVYVLGLGWDSETPPRLVIWLLPLWLISRYISNEPSSDESNTIADRQDVVSGPIGDGSR